MFTVIAQYPEYGFDILEDDNGRFMLLKDSDDLLPI